MHKLSEIEVLERITWEPAGKTSRALAELGVAHGFLGRADASPDAHHSRQVHGTKIVRADTLTTAPKATRRVECDGIFTTERNVRIAVRTADCLPVLFVDRAKRAVMAVHAGWRGLTSGILGDAVMKMEDLGIRPADWTAVIGPAIARESYEVGAEVIEALETGAIGLSAAQIGLSTSKGKGDRWQLDTVVAGVFALFNAGLPPSHIHVIQADTFKMHDWFSYRREGKGVASNWSWVSL